MLHPDPDAVSFRLLVIMRALVELGWISPN